jgi:hypothetical protein
MIFLVKSNKAEMQAQEFDEEDFDTIELTMKDDDDPSYFGQFEQVLDKKLDKNDILEKYLGHGLKYAEHIAKRKDAKGNPMPQSIKEPMQAYVSNDGDLYVMRDVSYATNLGSIQSLTFTGLYEDLTNDKHANILAKANTINAAGIDADGMPSVMSISKQ